MKAIYKELLTKQFLEYHYVELRKPISQIAKENNITNRSTVGKYLEKFNITRPPLRDAGKRLTREILIELYINQRKSMCDVAKHMGVKSTRFVRYALEREGIPIRVGLDAYKSYGKKECGKRKRTGFGGITGNTWNAICGNSKRRARNIEFNLTIEQAWNLFLSQEGKCALSGLDLHLCTYGDDFKNQTASLDRIDSNGGYTIDNVQWVHKDVNCMKFDLKEDYFIKMCRIIAENTKERDIS